MGFLGNFIRRWDLYKKVPDDLYVSTYSGACLSFFGILIMTLLFGLELQSFLKVTTTTDIVLERGEVSSDSHSGMLSINFNITVHDLPCEFASVDISDVTGERKHDIHQNIKKVRVDHRGRHLGKIKSKLAALEQILQEDASGEVHSDPVTGETFEDYVRDNSDQVIMMNFYAPWCIWCQRLEPVWEKAAAKLMGKHEHIAPITFAKVNCVEEKQLCQKHYIRGYPTIYIFTGGGLSPLEAYHGERTVTGLITKAYETLSRKEFKDHADLKKRHELDVVGHEGCNVSGRLLVKRVPGNFHMNLVSPRYDTENGMVNSSHTVHKLNFGDPINARYTDKLDDREFHTTRNSYTFVHYLKVVSKSFHFDSSTEEDDRKMHYYSYVCFPHEFEHKEDDGTPPSIMFQYDLSPMTVVTSFTKKPIYHFITNFCAIIGGVFTVIGIIDRFLGSILQGFNKKVL
eukprot:GSMAST32.ASY1.ANO1.1770.1 assembled CDS